MSPGFVGIVVTAGAVAAAALGYVAGQGQAACRCESAGCGACRGADGPPAAGAPLGAADSVWENTGRWERLTVGSIFRSRFATAASPLDGFEAVLVSPHATECLDDCPLALRVVGGARGTALLGKIVTSLGPNLRALAAAMPFRPDAARWIEAGTASLEARKDPDKVDAPGKNPLRALFVAMPRPDVGPRTCSVGFSLGDLPDPHFDEVAGEAGDREGWLLFVSRVEQYAPDGGSSLWGAVALVHASGRASWRGIPTTSPDLPAAFGAVWGHLGGLPNEAAGLLLDAKGAIHVFGHDLVLEPAPDEKALRAALIALLRRP